MLILVCLMFRSHFPSETVHTLKAHSDEVWFVQFSHDGSHLASGCKDGNIIIWKIEVKPQYIIIIVSFFHNFIVPLCSLRKLL